VKHLLGDAGSAHLQALTETRLLIALDFDGTLAPIVDDRDVARMRGPTRAALRKVCARYPCVVVSGRSREDVARRMRGVALSAVTGNHGADLGRASARMAKRVAAWRAELAARLPQDAGINLEDKGLSLSLHYRTTPSARRPRAALARLLARLGPQRLPHARIIEGKRVINLVPAEAPGKADAVAVMRRRLRCERVLFIGDDVTDEDVFAHADPRVVTSVRVGRTRHSAAQWYLRDQGEIDALLQRLLVLRG
jgi:trehalose 6-phosphate phosphatase